MAHGHHGTHGGHGHGLLGLAALAAVPGYRLALLLFALVVLCGG
jgi:hypothetical protein